MTLSAIQARPSEKGFTLVELAIVMIIIGLLIGGILKGQELINNARVSSSVAQIKAVEAAINTFKDKYAAYPGDVGNPTARLPNCTAAPCSTAGDGDSLIEVTGTANDVGGAAANDEGGRAFIHLAAASVLSSGGVDPIAAWAIGTALPDLNLGGKIAVGYNLSTVATTGLSSAGNLSGHYLAVGAAGTSMAAANVTLKSSNVANIDRKLDDGAPNVGSVRAAGSAGGAASNCVDAAAANGVYNEALDGASCGLFIRILN